MRAHPLAPYRVQHCGRTRYQKHVELLRLNGAAWWHGVVRCRARMCPVCWIARRAKSAAEISWVVGEWKRVQRTPSYLCTLTIRHSASDPVRITRQVRDLWRLILQRRKWRALKAELGLQSIVAEEVTRGDNGWHPHLHALWLVHRPIEDLEITASDLYEDWAALVEKKLGVDHVPLPDIGLDLRPFSAARYISKLGLDVDPDAGVHVNAAGYELTDVAAVKGRSPLQLLEHGQLDTYMTLQHARTRARDITYSRGLRMLRDAMPKTTAEAEQLLSLRGSEWGRLIELSPTAPLDVAEKAETARTALEAVIWWLGRVECADEVSGRDGSTLNERTVDEL